MHQQALEDLTERVNETLVEFRAPFRIKSGDNLEMTANFENGTVSAAADLSGGQKMVFALAFRLAVSSLFASQTGMLLLDEPTMGLD